MARCNVTSIDSIRNCLLYWLAAFPKSNVRSTSHWFTESCNWQCSSHFAAPFIVVRAKTKHDGGNDTLIEDGPNMCWTSRPPGMSNGVTITGKSIRYLIEGWALLTQKESPKTLWIDNVWRGVQGTLTVQKKKDVKNSSSQADVKSGKNKTNVTNVPMITHFLGLSDRLWFRHEEDLTFHSEVSLQTQFQKSRMERRCLVVLQWFVCDKSKTSTSGNSYECPHIFLLITTHGKTNQQHREKKAEVQHVIGHMGLLRKLIGQKHERLVTKGDHQLIMNHQEHNRKWKEERCVCAVMWRGSVCFCFCFSFFLFSLSDML